MKISILIASKNRERYINNLLYDIESQELRASEIIIIDQSEKKYTLTSNNKIFQIPDFGQGPCRARNLGLEKCTGEIIVFLDDDIHIEPDFLERLCVPIIKAETKVVVGAMCDEEGHYRNQENIAWRSNSRNWLLSLTTNPDFPGRCPALSFTTCCAAIHRSVYEKVGKFDEFFDPDGAGEDRDYGLRIFEAGFNILFDGSAKVNHLAALSGGRRDKAKSAPNYFGFSPIEANSYYLIAKHFGLNALDQQVYSMKYYYLSKLITINPKVIFRNLERIKNLTRLTKQLKAHFSNNK